MKVLVATNDAKHETIFSAAVKNGPCETVDTASGAFDAFKLLRRNRYALVISDDTLPEMGPLEFNLTVRDITDGRPVTVVAVPKDSSWIKHHQRFTFADLIESPENVVELLPNLTQAIQKDGRGALSGNGYQSSS